MLNRIVIMGRLTRDPELKFTKANVPVCTITLAVERNFRDSNDVRDVDFIDVVGWRGTAELICRRFRKGLLVAVDGRIQTRHWQDGYDQKRVTVEVVAESVYFAERTGNETPHQSPAATASPQGEAKRARSHGPRQDLKPVDIRYANVETDEYPGDYSGDLYEDDDYTI